mmetsp:Transcript_27024/g.61113  ORF Transcript_27024/g.61113 Transcript_27024/m.61113 type:complete len:101 (-) Transcript_27024:254-556(-)
MPNTACARDEASLSAALSSEVDRPLEVYNDVDIRFDEYLLPMTSCDGACRDADNSSTELDELELPCITDGMDRVELRSTPDLNADICWKILNFPRRGDVL